MCINPYRKGVRLIAKKKTATAKKTAAAKREHANPFSREETLKFLLSSNGKEKDAEIADDLLAEYAKLSDAFHDYRVKRTSPATRALIEVARDLTTSRLKRRVPSRRTRINTPDIAGKFFMEWFQGLDREEMAALYLDEQKRSMDCVTIARGDQYSVRLDVREVLSQAEALGARYVIIAHNHPHMPLLPSNADLRGTVVVSWSARMTGVELLDHIVVYDGDFVSLHESGLLSKDRRLSGTSFTVTDGELVATLGKNR